jgi:hypothetical protein
LGHGDLVKAEIGLMQKALTASNIEVAGDALTRAMKHLSRANDLFSALPKTGNLFNMGVVEEAESKAGNDE